MSIRIICPVCEQRSILRDEAEGRRVHCPKCSSVSLVPRVNRETGWSSSNTPWIAAGGVAIFSVALLIGVTIGLQKGQARRQPVPESAPTVATAPAPRHVSSVPAAPAAPSATTIVTPATTTEAPPAPAATESRTAAKVSQPAQPAPGSIYAKGHYRSDGTYVPPLLPRPGTAATVPASPSAKVAASPAAPVPTTTNSKPVVAENRTYYGQPNANGIPKTVHVNGYFRKDGTYVQGHYRSAPGSNSSTGRSRR